MSSSFHMSQADLLDRLQFQYEAQGFSFDREPRPADLPEFFQGYVPDALARKDQEIVVIEVKNRVSDPSTAARIAKIAEKIRQQPGYRFELVLTDVNKVSEGQLGSDDEVLSSRLRTGQDLLAKGDQASALLIAWSTLEGAVRARLGADSRALHKPLAARSLVSALVSFGLIEEDQEALMTTLGDQRNRIAHGGAGANVSPQLVQEVVDLAKRVLEMPKLEHV